MKKRMNSAVMIMTVICIVMLFTQCRSKETAVVSHDPEIIHLCEGPDYMSDADHFRARATAVSPDQQLSKRLARNNAYEEIASTLNAFMSSVMEIHEKQMRLSDNFQLTQRIESMIQTVVDEQLRGSRIICDRTTRSDNNHYTTYIAVELSAESILNAIGNSISRDEELLLDYQYERFRETFQEELKRLRDSRY